MKISCRVMAIGKAAVLVELGSGGSNNKKWIPFSMIEAGMENMARGVILDLEVNNAFAKKEGLES